jgi:hypothetical protein
MLDKGESGFDVNHDGKEDFRDAAILAEIDTGHAEDTPEQAWYHALVRLGRMTLGFGVLLIGIAMLVLPGPGAVVSASGLVILSRDVAWADRALRYLRKRTPGLEEDGPIPKSTIAISLMLMTAAGLTAWWWFNGGSGTVSDWFSR